jgi:benzodiazapine receptor
MTAIASRGQLRLSLLRYVLVTVPLILLLGTVSTTMSDASGYSAWFRALAHPDFAPAEWVIGTVTMLSWLLLGIVLAMLLHARGARRRRLALVLFGVLLLIALAWPPVLFAFHEIGASLVLIAAMSLAAVVLIGMLWPMRRLAALLMLLYLGWLGYLAVLSWRLVELNPVAPQPPSTDIIL